MSRECLAERGLGCSSPCSENTVRKTLQPLSDDDMTVCPLVTIGALVSLAALAGTVQGSKRPPQGPGPTATRLGRPSTEAAGGANTGETTETPASAHQDDDPWDSGNLAAADTDRAHTTVLSRRRSPATATPTARPPRQPPPAHKKTTGLEAPAKTAAAAELPSSGQCKPPH